MLMKSMEGCHWKIKWDRNANFKGRDICALDCSGLAMADG